MISGLMKSKRLAIAMTVDRWPWAVGGKKVRFLELGKAHETRYGIIDPERFILVVNCRPSTVTPRSAL
jgi:hypothetical protein